MEEILKQINNSLNKFDWISFLLTTLTIIISVVAVIISISTANKQNKLNLFDKRFNIYNKLYQIKSILDLTYKDLENGKSTNTLYAINDLLYKFKIEDYDDCGDTLYVIQKITIDIGKIKFLFPKLNKLKYIEEHSQLLTGFLYQCRIEGKLLDTSKMPKIGKKSYQDAMKFFIESDILYQMEKYLIL